MKREIIIAGFGGQGVMSVGKTLVEAGMEEGLEVSWVPSYGPEMRGGTANCSVILSPQTIGSPIVSNPTELIAMNEPSLAKFVDSVQPGGFIFLNGMDIHPEKVPEDVKVINVPCGEIAARLGNPKVANMVMLGAYVGATEALKVETIEEMIHEMFTGKKAKLVPLNLEALHRGIACAKEQMA
jgi:2-oxoglutarate ferredoxin oxidoreductase subunit gamma